MNEGPPMGDSDRANPDRDRFRSALVEGLREHIGAALDADYIEEANALLDALVLLGRGVGADLEAPITAEERLSVEL